MTSRTHTDSQMHDQNTTSKSNVTKYSAANFFKNRNIEVSLTVAR